MGFGNRAGGRPSLLTHGRLQVISKGYFASQSTLCLPQSAKFQTFMALDYRAGAAIMLVTSANALAYNVIHNAMIKMTSAVTTTVIGEAKIVGLFILSALLLGEPILPHILDSTLMPALEPLWPRCKFRPCLQP